MYLRVLCLCFALLSLVGCNEKESTNSQTPLIVITSPDNPPFEFKDTARGNDKVIGFDIDVIHEVGKRLGRPIKIVEAGFAGLIPALQSGRADIAIAGFSPTEERRKSVDFSDPYHIDKKALLVLKDSSITSEKDLQNQTIGAQFGSAHEMTAQKWAANTPGLSVIALGKVGELVQELKNERIQAIIVEDTVALKIAHATPGLKVIILTVEGGPSAIAFPKGSPLVEPTNEVLKAMKGDLEKLEAKWFYPETQPNSEAIWSSVPFILEGIPITLTYTIASLCLGFLWGALLAFCKVSHVSALKWFATFYTSIFRGTPLLLQLLLIYHASPQFIGYKFSIWEAGILTFTLNSGAYISEHIRSGINAVDKGQMEAALSLGLSYPLIMKDIILPQAIRNILPSLVNESIDLLKESALIFTIGGADILGRANIVASAKFIVFEPYLIAGCLYYILVMVLTSGARLLEKRLKTS